MTSTQTLTEDALALEFAARYAGQLRYVNAVSPKRWFVLSGDTWQPDTSLQVLDMVRAVCRAAAARCANPALASAWVISAVERLARTDRRLAATKEQVGIVAKRRRGGDT